MTTTSPKASPEAEPTPTSAWDVQVGGRHYKDYAIQPTEYAMRNKLDTCQANVVKYVTRFRDKGGLSDLEKAIHYIRLLAEFEGYDRPQ